MRSYMFFSQYSGLPIDLYPLCSVLNKRHWRSLPVRAICRFAASVCALAFYAKIHRILWGSPAAVMARLKPSSTFSLLQTK